MKMPTRADIAAKRIGVFKDTIRKTIAEGDLDMYVELVEQLVEEGPFDMADIAAAAARIANGSRSLVKAREEETVERIEARSDAAAPRRERITQRDDAAADSDDTGATDKTITLSMSVGRANGIRPADVVGSIANEADIPGREIGPIDIQEDITYVGIPQRYVEVVLEKVGKARFRGRAVNLKIALPGSQTARRPSPRPDRDDRPPRKYDREGSGLPNRASDRGGSGLRKHAEHSEGSGLRDRTDVGSGRPDPKSRYGRPDPDKPRPYDRPRPSGSATPRRPMASGPRDHVGSGPRDRVTRATGSGPRDRAAAPATRSYTRDDRAPRASARPGSADRPPRRDDRLPGREYSPRTPKPFYSDVKKGGFKGKKRK
jgi:hypothetical protein